MYSDASPSPIGGAPARRPRVAIVGSGIAGLAAAHSLSGLAELTLFEAGADVFVAGSAVYRADEPAEACRRLRALAQGATDSSWWCP